MYSVIYKKEKPSPEIRKKYNINGAYKKNNLRKPILDILTYITNKIVNFTFLSF